MAGESFGITSNTGCERCRESERKRLIIEQGKFPNEEEEEKAANTHTLCNKQPLVCKTSSSVTNSFKTTSTIEAQEINSIDSRKRASMTNTEDKTSVITSAQLHADSDDSYIVGLDVHSELTVKYNQKLKNDLRSKCLIDP